MEIKIGTQFKALGKRGDIKTIIDIHKTFNHVGELVRTTYVTTHNFCGQAIKTYDVTNTEVRRGIIEQAA